ncbi:glycosyltransferase family 4 protein [archaeon]|jgi:glycosyltransferase involved in cell wall biosynthesis|nr:glycosyltransferase family 4 protein [archaeon]MBT3730447.1 glycosyltransferase family 4 protein [archaeon]MBT4670430.1 glycosyltransferase family 4 protein [archaeon]MBT5030105.1 glycosyltransferase family 4 protein [archaeon]MBT5288204.1 glycosyltransferase family 4 protein [archaeon]
MKLDLYFGRHTKEIFGMNRCKLELLQGLPKDINKKIISYKPKNRILNFLDFLTYAPLSVIKKRRNNSISYILSQADAHILNFFRFKKSIVLCYDIIPLVLPYGTKFQKLKAKFAYRGMCKADHIIAISQFTKDEIVKHLNYPKERITVAHIGVDHNLYKPIKDLKEIKKKYNLSDKNKYLIYVGNEEPRMNLLTLLKALKLAQKEIPNLKLIKVGKSNYPEMREKLNRYIKKLNLEKDIIFTNYVPEQDMPYLYNIADISIYLCSYAGFGLPPLESMTCGTPTITSNRSSLPEVIGKGGITLDEKDYKELSKEIIKIIKDKKYSEELSKKGIKQSKKFTWENFVNKNLEIISLLSNK